MAQPTVEIRGPGLDVLNKFLKDAPNEIPKQTAIVLNQTARKHKRDISKQVRTKVAIDAKGANEAIGIRKANRGNLTSKVIVKHEFRPSLKRFKAKQTKRGVSYRISKQGGRQTVPGAFGPNINRLGNHVYKRNGKKIQKLHGVSLWGVYLKNDMVYWTQVEVKAALNHQVRRRIRALIFKAQKAAKR